MSWVLDTCIVLDVAVRDPRFFDATCGLLEEKASDGWCVSPVTVVELLPLYRGHLPLLREFFRESGIDDRQPWTVADTENAGRGYWHYVNMKRAGKSPRRPIADILIGGFACRFQGLITRNPDDFRPYFRQLPLLVPAA
jgi:predicted nucleic acid-binding protein